MATKKEVIRLPVKIYHVISAKVGDKLGPHKVLSSQGGARVVALNERQAKYYLTTGVIAESA